MANNGALFQDFTPRPVDVSGKSFPGGFYIFYLTGTTTPALVYQDAGLSVPFNGNPTADGTGAFPPIFMDSGIIYRVQLFNAAGQLQKDVDPYIPYLTVLGNGALVLNTITGQVVINAPKPGGTGVALTIVAAPGALALQINGSSPGTPAIQILNAAGTGTQTAIFTATNKPGASSSAPSNWLPLNIAGVTYFVPLWL